SSTPVPSTSTSAPWTRAVTCASASELRVLFLDRAEHLVARLGLEQPLAEGGIAKEAGDAGQRLQVLAARVLRHDEQEEQVGGLPVDRLEVHAFAAAREGG